MTTGIVVVAVRNLCNPGPTSRSRRAAVIWLMVGACAWAASCGGEVGRHMKLHSPTRLYDSRERALEVVRALKSGEMTMAAAL